MTSATWVIRAEWTKLRTVRGWMVGLLLVPALTVLLSTFISSQSLCSSMTIGPDGRSEPAACAGTIGPDGELVQGHFYFVHEPLAGDGTVTARITSLTASDLQPWAKAGIIVKTTSTPGSAYVAMMVTGGHGVRMQWNFTGDTAGMAGTVSAASSRWLRLVRSGGTVTGYDSADGTRWHRVGAVTLAGPGRAVQAGLLATTPQPRFTGHREAGRATVVVATFDHVTISGTTPRTWTGTDVGAPAVGIGPPGSPPDPAAAYSQADGVVTVTGDGDIAPDTGEGSGVGMPVSHTLDGAFAGLIAAIVIGVAVSAGEYRRGLIGTTLAATPQRGRVLAAKALVLGAVTFAAALIGCALCVPLGERLLRENGNVIDPASALTVLRVVTGTAAIFAPIAAFAVALGVIFRRGAAAAMTCIMLVVVPWFLAVSGPALPASAADWLLRVSPAAALAIQQTLPEYPQVDGSYLPLRGFYPLAGWAGILVLAAWTGGALAVAAWLLRRRDA